MNEGRIVFSQVMDFLPLHRFRQCVERYGGDYKIQSFTCLDQFLCLAFAQLTSQENLRESHGQDDRESGGPMSDLGIRQAAGNGLGGEPVVPFIHPRVHHHEGRQAEEKREEKESDEDEQISAPLMRAVLSGPQRCTCQLSSPTSSYPQ